ncbi:MAG: DUF3473 domain-containing protein [Chromatiales bacterium]|jgi:polysaccharide deacetylase family protein (PEP-CTERM system associated)|nr:DUF3473 domain-containing protein [Chromatiales bacterium]
MEQDGQIVNAMSVDVEDYFQVSAFEGVFDKAHWGTIPCRVERNTDRILALFDERSVKATFFTLGWVAERYPELVRRIADCGHEIASHGFSHIRATEQSVGEFAQDVCRTRKLLQDVSGQAVHGYRAASFSIGSGNLWALHELLEAGYSYSSSINPIHHDLYGMPHAPRFAFRPKHAPLIEIPISTIRMMGRNVPCGGGGFFRLLPYWYFKWAISQLNKDASESAIFYFHPWELDAEQPRPGNMPLKARFRHYTNLDKMEQRLRMLLSEFRWGSMDDVFMNRADVPIVDLTVPQATQAA